MKPKKEHQFIDTNIYLKLKFVIIPQSVNIFWFFLFTICLWFRWLFISFGQIPVTWAFKLLFFSYFSNEIRASQHTPSILAWIILATKGSWQAIVYRVKSCGHNWSNLATMLMHKTTWTKIPNVWSLSTIPIISSEVKVHPWVAVNCLYII